MEFHPAANLFPLMAVSEFEELVADIEKRGVLEAITVLGGQILDGRNRWRACEELGIEPPTTDFRGPDPYAFVIAKNIRRRQLNESQRAIIAAEMTEHFAEEAKKRQLSHLKRGDAPPVTEEIPEREKGLSRDKAAATFSVNSRYVQDAKTIRKERPDLAERIKKGELTIPQAMRKIRPAPMTRKTSALTGLKRLWKKATGEERKMFWAWIPSETKITLLDQPKILPPNQPKGKNNGSMD